MTYIELRHRRIYETPMAEYKTISISFNNINPIWNATNTYSIQGVSFMILLFSLSYITSIFSQGIQIKKEHHEYGTLYILVYYI